MDKLGTYILNGFVKIKGMQMQFRLNIVCVKSWNLVQI